MNYEEPLRRSNLMKRSSSKNENNGIDAVKWVARIRASSKSSLLLVLHHILIWNVKLCTQSQERKDVRNKLVCCLLHFVYLAFWALHCEVENRNLLMLCQGQRWMVEDSSIWLKIVHIGWILYESFKPMLPMKHSKFFPNNSEEMSNFQEKSQNNGKRGWIVNRRNSNKNRRAAKKLEHNP